MAIEMVLNEHSLQKASDENEARKWMDQLVATMQAASKAEVERSLRTTGRKFEMHLADDYSLIEWFKDDKVNRDKRKYFGLLSKKKRPWDDLLDLDDQVNTYQLSHTGYNHKAPVVCGLWVSHLVNALAISLPSHQDWNSNKLDLGIQWLNEKGDIQSKCVKVIHASHPDHVNDHKDWIEERLAIKIKNGSILWENKDNLFPSLTFCDDTQKQIQNLDKNKTMLERVKNRLSDLQAHCEKWTFGGFDKNDLKGNPRTETQATLDQYGDQRTFKCPDGEDREFSWHVSIPKNWRLYFIPKSELEESDLDEGKKMIIGYIGPHLNTVTGKAN